MSALVCDICGGKLKIGTGGIATCENCGMEHSKDRLQEKVLEIKGVVKVDNSHLVENYLNLAENAYDSSNLDECESYCNKAIEIEPNNYNAWLIKGKASGWQSTIANIRLGEASNCFANAINFSPEEVREELIEISKTQFRDISIALINLRGNRFSKYPDDEETSGFSSDISQIMSACLDLFSKSNILVTGFMEPIANAINQSVVNAFQKKILPDYGEGFLTSHSNYDVEKFINGCANCVILLENAIELSDSDQEEDIQRYENAIFILGKMLTAKSSEGKSLNSNAKAIAQSKIFNYNLKIKEIKEQLVVLKREKRKHFWEEHSETYSELMSIMKDLELKLEESKKIKFNVGVDLIKEKIDRINSVLNRDRNIEDSLSSEDLELLDTFKEWENNRLKITTDFTKQREKRIEEYNEIAEKIKVQKRIIDENNGSFFGDKAKIRKDAQQNLKSLESELFNYRDLIK